MSFVIEKPLATNASSPIRSLPLAVLTLLLPPLIFPALSTSASAFQKPQQSVAIAGIVVDQNGAPVANAQIILANSSSKMSAGTDPDGRFRFASASEAPLILTVTSEGFARFERRLNPLAEDLTQLRIVLEPAPVSAVVTISATRTETRISETAASVVVLTPKDLDVTAALTIDDALRQAPGFNLFRRNGSRVANPTTQGVSLRGLGASGASRALVLADGIPLNDPFGGWVYWDRVPHESINQMEVLRGGASHLYGSTALGGLVTISTKSADKDSLAFSTSYGNEQTPNASVFLTGKKRGWGTSLGGEFFSTNGYVLVAPGERGLVDTAAASRHAVETIKAERWFGKQVHVFAAGSFFGESRRNGTPLQINRTHTRQFSCGGELLSPKAGDFSARGYGGTQVYDQTFSAISADRSSETLTRLQRVPAQFLGFSGQWSRLAGHKRKLVAGFESLQVRGASDEIVFTSGRASSLVDAGGRQQTFGGYFEDLLRFGSRLFLNAGARFDFWRNYKASSATRTVAPPATASISLFPDRTESAFSPQLSAVYKINSRLSLLFSGMRAFRAPTLNELYRSFRVGNVLTLANENLRAERLTGGETGLRFSSLNEKFVLRGDFFWNEVTRPIANVTLRTTPALITRQRQNLGRTRSRGIEIEADAHPQRFWTVSAGYLFVDATVVRFPANPGTPGLEGLLIPQIARHQFTFQARYANPSIVTFAVQGRGSSAQFDDDQNLFRLRRYFTLDAFLSRRLGQGVEAFIAAENLLNQRYETGKTPVTTIGPPVLLRVGFRLRLSGR